MSDISDRVKEINADLATHPAGCRCPGHLIIEIKHLRAENDSLLKDASVWRNEAINRRDDRSQAFLDAAKMLDERAQKHCKNAQFGWTAASHEAQECADELRRAAEGVEDA